MSSMTFSPAAMQNASRISYGAGAPAEYGSARPMASDTVAMVLAVNWAPQAPSADTKSRTEWCSAQRQATRCGAGTGADVAEQPLPLGDQLHGYARRTPGRSFSASVGVSRSRRLAWRATSDKVARVDFTSKNITAPLARLFLLKSRLRDVFMMLNDIEQHHLRLRVSLSW